MTIGIYKLNFPGTDKVYIGQSICIESRYKTHINSLNNGTSTYKMLEAFSTYGSPALEIILECTIQELDTAEAEAISIYNSVNNGFNILDMSISGIAKGYSSGRCTNTKDELLYAANLLLDTTLTIGKIESITKVSESTLRKILSGTRHIWLAEEFPELWHNLGLVRGTRKAGSPDAKARGIVYPKVISPEGLVMEVTNTNKFAKDHGLSQGSFYNMLRGMYSQHKGWRLA